VKNVPFSAGYARHDVMHFWLFVECAKVVGATSSEGVLVKAKFHYAILVTDRSEAGRRPAASWNLAYHLAR